MLTTDYYGKTISSDFNNAIVAKGQKVKPKIIVNWLDSRHLSNLVVTTNDVYSNTSYPNRGFYFGPSEAFNGIERQSFTWGVAGAKDEDGDVIRADGSYYAMPSLTTGDLSNTHIGSSLEFGWWSNTASTANTSNTYSGYTFTTAPYVQAVFDERKVNKVRIITSELYGQISDYTVEAYNANTLVLSETGRIANGSYYQDHFISTALSTQNITKIKVTVHSTKNPNDYARIQEIVPLYQVDMSDYVQDYSIARARDVHSTSMPIGGSEIASADISFDNTGKKFNIFDSTSDFGKYMQKDLKVEIYTGWRIKKPSTDYINSSYLQTFLKANMNTTTTTATVNDVSVFSSGGANNYFVVIIDENTQNEEYVLCSGTSGNSTLNIVSRGYGGSVAKSHSTNAIVKFDIYEYVKNGTFYVDEWNSKSGDMSVSASLQDWSKYLAERTVSYGFFIQNITVGEAVENLLMRANFPKKDIKRLSTYKKGAISRGAIAMYSFNEDTVDRSGNNIVSSSGLRARFWGMPENQRDISVKDIKADAIDKELTELDKALGELAFVSPSYIALSKDISTNSTYAVQLDDYSFTGLNSVVYKDYYNGVFDGFYIPKNNGPQTIVVYIRSGGVRVYLDDHLILNQWKTSSSFTRYESSTLNLIAGVPRKIRIEFFHNWNNTAGTPSFKIYLYKSVNGAADVLIPASECCTIAAIDSIGSRNPSGVITDNDAANHRSSGVYIASPKLSQATGLVSDPNNKAVLLESNAYIRTALHTSMNLTNSASPLYTGKWSIEFFAKFNSGTFSSDGEYISNWANASPATGFEFFNNSSSNGFKIRTLSNSVVITETVSSNTALSTSNFSHITTTFDGTTMYYYVNGVLKANTTLVGTPISWANTNITIGGRGASYTAGTGEVAPSTIRSFIIDEFAIYNQYLSSTDVQERYSEASIQPLTIFGYLYGNDNSIQEIINDITFADLGRTYVDEEGKARYEHFYRFFEPSIPQHANIQATISDSSHIISADYAVQLQCNKVTIAISSLQKNVSKVQPLWHAEANSSLISTTLTANLTSTANVVYVTSTINPDFLNSGYIKIQDEIIEYTAKTKTSFTGLKRGQFQTTAAAHVINDDNNSKVREARYYNIKYDNSPAFNIRKPFITSIDIDDPPQAEIVRFLHHAYGAELILATANTVPAGEVVVLEGENPKTKYQNSTSLAGVVVEISEKTAQVKEQSSVNSESIKKYGLKDIDISSPFINDAVHAQRLAELIISKTQIPVPILNISTIAMPKVQLGDRIRISNITALGISNTDYWVISHQLSVGGTVTQSMVLRQVS